MAEENQARSGPETGTKSPADRSAVPSPSGGREYTPPVRRRSNRRRNVVILVLVVVLVVAGVLLWRYLSSYESTDDAQADVHLYPVSARVSGYVVKVNIDDNQWVEKGAVLVEIDPKDYEVAVQQAQANLTNAEATAEALNITVPITSVNTSSQLKFAASGIEDANAGVIVAERQLTAAHAQVESAEANDLKAQDDLHRYKLLVDKREVSQQIYDQALAAAKSSTATVAGANASESAAREFVKQARSRLAQADANHQYAETGPQQVSSTRARVRAAIADVEQKRALLEQAQLNLQYTKIVAPVNGVVSNRTVEVGQNVAPGQELMKIINLDDVWITANFKETQLREMKVGQRVTIDVDANGRTYNGKVDSVAGASGARFSLLPPENATGNYVKVVQRIPVKIVLDAGANNDHQLRPGMSVTPKVWIR